MKTLLTLLIFFLMIALPALGELTTQDMEKIRQIIKESETALKSDMEKIRQLVKESETALKQDIEKITSKIDAIDTRLRTVEIGVAELRGRNIGFSVLKDSLVTLCAVAAIIISIIALRKNNPPSHRPHMTPKRQCLNDRHKTMCRSLIHKLTLVMSSVSSAIQTK